AGPVQEVLNGLGWDVGEEGYQPFSLEDNQDHRPDNNIVHIGIDLAWGFNNQSGVAYWKPGWQKAKTELFDPVRGNGQQTAVKLCERIKEISAGSKNVIIAIDAPLKCPQDATLREWETYIRAVYTSYDKYCTSMGAMLVKELEHRGFNDLFSDFETNISTITGGGNIGLKYVEAYPNPTMYAMARKKIKYKEGRYNKIPHDELVQALNDAIQVFKSLSWPFEIELTADSFNHQRKQIEDQFDAVVCLALTVMLTNSNIVEKNFSDGGLFAVGGINLDVENGAILTPLINEQIAEIPEAILHNVFKPKAKVPPALASAEHTANIAPTAEQNAVINCTAPLVRVIARAGTGKTTTMIHRASRIIQDDPSAQVLMLTFTRNAADAMREKYFKINSGTSKDD
ncbi:MAG: DUF429 domain-containing protein, partial [Deltaproteobacteria bacterium]|nr:DUF429 domain-containing protein [Deltaproteobacteria bacterium]